MASDEWFYTLGGQQQGPAPLEHLKHWLAHGQLQPTELVWREGMVGWVEAAAVPELRGVAPALTDPAAAGVPPAPPTTFGQAQPLGYQAMQLGAFDPDVSSQVNRARSAMICGIVGLLGVCCALVGIVLGPTAIVLASMSMSSMKQTGSQQGKGMATAGLVLGIVDVVLAVGIVKLSLLRW